MKTKQAIAKRFKITKNGKMLRRMTGQDHLRAKKSSKRRRAGRKWVPVSKSEAKKIKALLGY